MTWTRKDQQLLLAHAKTFRSEAGAAAALGLTRQAHHRYLHGARSPCCEHAERALRGLLEAQIKSAAPNK